MLYRSKNAMIYKKLNDNEIRCLRKIFITWLKKEGYYEDYIEAKMYLKIHYQSPVSDGWPHDLNESGIYCFFNDYCNIIDRTLDYHRCRGIRSDWCNINKEWGNFIDKHYELIVGRFFRDKRTSRAKIIKRI